MLIGGSEPRPSRSHSRADSDAARDPHFVRAAELLRAHESGRTTTPSPDNSLRQVVVRACLRSLSPLVVMEGDHYLLSAWWNSPGRLLGFLYASTDMVSPPFRPSTAGGRALAAPSCTSKERPDA